MNKVLFRAIQKSLVSDIRGVYNTFSEEYDNLQGLILQLNINRTLGEYLKQNPSKIEELLLYLNKEVDFKVKLLFTSTDEEKFYPIIDEN